MKKLLKTFVIGVALIASQSVFAQSSSDAVLEAAPHLPTMVKAEAEDTDVFNGVNNAYKNDLNLESLKAWAEAYPSEVTAYKEAMESFLTTDYESLSDSEKEVFNNLKSQWIMFIQL